MVRHGADEMRRRSTGAVVAVLGRNEDLIALILTQARLSPTALVIASRVSKSWHAVCTRDDELLLRCVNEAPYLTKRVVVGLFALTSREADRLPRTTCTRRDGGLMYKYDPSQGGAGIGSGGWYGGVACAPRKACGIRERCDSDVWSGLAHVLGIPEPRHGVPSVRSLLNASASFRVVAPPGCGLGGGEVRGLHPAGGLFIPFLPVFS